MIIDGQIIFSTLRIYTGHRQGHIPQRYIARISYRPHKRFAIGTNAQCRTPEISRPRHITINLQHTNGIAITGKIGGIHRRYGIRHIRHATGRLQSGHMTSGQHRLYIVKIFIRFDEVRRNLARIIPVDVFPTCQSRPHHFRVQAIKI